jgi:hypothetical protein
MASRRRRSWRGQATTLEPLGHEHVQLPGKPCPRKLPTSVLLFRAWSGYIGPLLPFVAELGARGALDVRPPLKLPGEPSLRTHPALLAAVMAFKRPLLPHIG